MDEFEEAFHAAQDSEQAAHFDNLSKIAQAMSEAEKTRYGQTNPIRIWMVAGPSEDMAIAISAN